VPALDLVQDDALPGRQQLVHSRGFLGLVPERVQDWHRGVAQTGRGPAAVSQLGDQRADRVAAVCRLTDQAVLLHRQQEPVHGAGGQTGGTGQVTDAQVRGAGVEASQDRHRPVDGLHRPPADLRFLHGERLSHDAGSEAGISRFLDS
jgi:hypothetical protein